ncbi:MAG TPA: hypothetical protein VIG07_10700 [Methylomirabilota bacterium]|jgi:hypothetical protein
MDTHMDLQLAKDRLAEARATAAQWALVRSLRPARRPVRVTVGLALIKIGYWLAGRTPRRATA